MSRPSITPLDRECDVCLTRRATIALFCIIVVFSVLSVRIFFLQMIQHKVVAEKVERTRLREEILPAARGPILDTKMRLLTSDEAVQKVVFDNIWMRGKGAVERMAEAMAKSENGTAADLRRSWTEEETRGRFIWWMCSLIAPALEEPAEDIVKRITDRPDGKGGVQPPHHGSTDLAKEINAQQASQLNRILEAYPLGCLSVEAGFRRTKLVDPTLAPIVGTINFHGPTGGVEKARNAELTGTPGKRTFEIDHSRREIAGFENEIVPPQQGKAMRLTYDTTMHDIVTAEVLKTGNDPKEIYLSPLKPERVMVVIMDARSMAIRAIVGMHKDPETGELVPNQNNAASVEVYEPGSIIKVVTVATAVDSGKVNLNTPITINGPTYNDADVETITDDKAYGTLRVRDILVESSNIGAYKLARTVGIKKFIESYTNFGFGQRSNFMGIKERSDETDLLESRGIMPAAQKWTYNTLARASFGYNISVTPIQMCGALGAIVNDGWYREPYLVEAVLDSRNQVLEEHQPKHLRQVISPAAAKATREAMLEVVERGTGTKAQSEDFQIAAKTGTARKSSENGPGYVKGKYVVSMLGFAPVKNPKLIALVVIDSPRGTAESLYAGKLAAPVFRRVMESALRYYEVPTEVLTHVSKPRH